MFETKVSNMSYVSYKNDLTKHIPIAPSQNQKTKEEIVPRKYNYKSNPYIGAQAASIARRNARERNRVKQVNDGFNALRRRLPAAVINALSGGARRGTGKKLSKVDTLRMVVEYIRYLENLVDSDAALGITNASTSKETDGGFIAGRTSPYSDSIPSPVDSECSSGVFSSYSLSNEFYVQSITCHNEYIMNEHEMLDELWCQPK